MNNRIIIFLLLSAFTLLVSCQKDVDVFIPNGTPVGADTNWISSITTSSPVIELKHSLNRDVAFDSIDCTVGGTITTSEGLTIILPPLGLLLPNGTPASGKVYVESMLITQKGDMIRMDKPTTSNNSLLVSGGEVYVKIRKDADELHLAVNKRIYVRYADPAPSTAMRLFYGDESNFNQFNWVPAFDSSTLSATSQGGVIGYVISTGNLRWLNCDRFADSTGQRVNIIASLPVDYTNANTSVYLVFHDLKSIMGMNGDPVTKKFISARVPVGKLVTVVSITKKGANSYYLGHESTTTGQSGTSAGQTVPLTPQPMSLTDIKAYLATL